MPLHPPVAHLPQQLAVVAHLAAVGDPKEVREFVSELSRVMSDFIRSADEKEDKTSAKYAGFNIEL